MQGLNNTVDNTAFFNELYKVASNQTGEANLGLDQTVEGGGSLAGRKIVQLPSGTQDAHNIRRILAESLTGGVETEAMRAIRSELLGPDGADANKPVSKTLAQRAISAIRAKGDNVEKLIGKAVTVAEVPADARAILKDIIAKNPGNTHIREFLDAYSNDRTDLDAFRRVCKLAADANEGNVLGLAYLRGFAGDITVTDSLPLSEAQMERQGEVDYAHQVVKDCGERLGVKLDEVENFKDQASGVPEIKGQKDAFKALDGLGGEFAKGLSGEGNPDLAKLGADARTVSDWILKQLFSVQRDAEISATLFSDEVVGGQGAATPEQVEALGTALAALPREDPETKMTQSGLTKRIAIFNHLPKSVRDLLTKENATKEVGCWIANLVESAHGFLSAPARAFECRRDNIRTEQDAFNLLDDLGRQVRKFLSQDDQYAVKPPSVTTAKLFGKQILAALKSLPGGKTDSSVLFSDRVAPQRMSEDDVGVKAFKSAVLRLRPGLDETKQAKLTNLFRQLPDSMRQLMADQKFANPDVECREVQEWIADFVLTAAGNLDQTEADEVPKTTSQQPTSEQVRQDKIDEGGEKKLEGQGTADDQTNRKGDETIIRGPISEQAVDDVDNKGTDVTSVNGKDTEKKGSAVPSDTDELLKEAQKEAQIPENEKKEKEEKTENSRAAKLYGFVSGLDDESRQEILKVLDAQPEDGVSSEKPYSQRWLDAYCKWEFKRLAEDFKDSANVLQLLQSLGLSSNASGEAQELISAFQLLGDGFGNNNDLMEALGEAVYHALSGGEDSPDAVQKALRQCLVGELRKIADAQKSNVATKSVEAPCAMSKPTVGSGIAAGDPRCCPSGVESANQLADGVVFGQSLKNNTCPIISVVNAMMLTGGKMAQAVKNVMVRHLDDNRSYYEFPYLVGDPKRPQRVYVDELGQEPFGSSTMSEFEKAAFLALSKAQLTRFQPGTSFEVDGVFKLFGLDLDLEVQGMKRRYGGLPKGDLCIYGKQVADAIKKGQPCVLSIPGHFMAIQSVSFDTHGLPTFHVVESARDDGPNLESYGPEKIENTIQAFAKNASAFNGVQFFIGMEKVPEPVVQREEPKDNPESHESNEINTEEAKAEVEVEIEEKKVEVEEGKEEENIDTGNDTQKEVGGDDVKTVNVATEINNTTNPDEAKEEVSKAETLEDLENELGERLSSGGMDQAVGVKFLEDLWNKTASLMGEDKERNGKILDVARSLSREAIRACAQKLGENKTQLLVLGSNQSVSNPNQDEYDLALLERLKALRLPSSAEKGALEAFRRLPLSMRQLMTGSGTGSSDIRDHIVALTLSVAMNLRSIPEAALWKVLQRLPVTWNGGAKRPDEGRVNEIINACADSNFALERPKKEDVQTGICEVVVRQWVNRCLGRNQDGLPTGISKQDVDSDKQRIALMNKQGRRVRSWGGFCGLYKTAGHVFSVIPVRDGNMTSPHIPRLLQDMKAGGYAYVTGGQTGLALAVYREKDGTHFSFLDPTRGLFRGTAEQIAVLLADGMQGWDGKASMIIGIPPAQMAMGPNLGEEDAVDAEKVGENEEVDEGVENELAVLQAQMRKDYKNEIAGFTDQQQGHDALTKIWTDKDLFGEGVAVEEKIRLSKQVIDKCLALAQNDGKGLFPTKQFGPKYGDDRPDYSSIVEEKMSAWKMSLTGKEDVLEAIGRLPPAMCELMLESGNGVDDGVLTVALYAAMKMGLIKEDVYGAALANIPARNDISGAASGT